MRIRDHIPRTKNSVWSPQRLRLTLRGFEIVTDRFLSSAKPEVLCVRGAWGVGKTHAWKQAIDRARTAGTVPLESYAYVSLFGVNSLDELKQAAFDNTVGKKNAGLDATFETLDDFLATSRSVGKWALGKLSSIVAHTGIVSRYVNIGPALFLSVWDRLICIDDKERRGEKLKIADVLGLISLLKEQRRCKIVLLLNDDAILAEERANFDAYFEKVVDVSFRFAPSPVDATRIAFPSQDGLTQKIAERCQALQITNIRILYKIGQFIDAISPLIREFDPDVIDQAISTVVFLFWVVY
jgi:hypothetical protein